MSKIKKLNAIFVKLTIEIKKIKNCSSRALEGFEVGLEIFIKLTIEY